MGSDSALKLDYLSLAELAERPAAWWQNVLGVAAFDAAQHRERPVRICPMATWRRRYRVRALGAMRFGAPHAARSGTRGGFNIEPVLVSFLAA